MVRPEIKLIILAIVLSLLAAAGFLFLSKREQAGKPAEREAASRPSGRERCAQKCSAIHKGYVYMAERRLEGRVEPEKCRCV